VAPTSTQPTTAPDRTPSVTAGQLNAATLAAAALGRGWTGPVAQGSGYARLDNTVQGCPARAGVLTAHEAAKPGQGILVAYQTADQNTVLNQVQLTIGVDTAARAKAYVDFLRTVPTSCPDGKVDKYPFHLTAGASRSLGDEDVTLHSVVDLGDGSPLELDTGVVRIGGLVVSFYGATDQVDRYLPAAAAAARAALAGTVSGV
jgi:hypothetical protein